MLLKLMGGDLEALAHDALGEFCRRSRQGPVVPLRIGFRRGHLVSTPEPVRHVLLDNFANDETHPLLRCRPDRARQCMLTSEGPHWKRQRRIAQPAFHGERVRRFAPILSRMAAECADEWESAARSGRTVDACADMMRVTLRAVAETLFGDDLGASAAEINRVFPTILACLAARIASPVRTPLWLPQLWSDPEAFLPERFEPGGEEQRNKFAYLPFGAGPRICLGASFAMIESQIIAGTLLARFRARLADPAPVMPQPQVTLRPSHPVELRLERAPLA